jgi:hypothetical protein
LLLSSAGQALGQTETLSAIRVQGNVVATDAEVQALVGIAIGSPLAPDTVDVVTARLRASKRFDRVDVLKRFASLTDPTAILLVVIVDEGPVRIVMTGDPNQPTRVVRSRWPKMLFLPVLSTTEGYGLTYGLRFALPDPAGPHSRITFPLTWGGDKRAGVEFDKTWDDRFINRLIAVGTVSSTADSFFDADIERQRVGVRAEHHVTPQVRVGTVGAWQHISFPGGVDSDSFTQFGVDFVVDTRLDPLLARNAVYLRAAWDRLTLTPGAVNRTELVARTHISVGRPILVLGAQREDSDKPLPGYLRPQLGGLSNLRGFPPGFAIGDTLVAGTIELLVPLATPFRFATIGVSGFTDAGVVYNKGERLTDQHINQSIGASIWGAAAFLRVSLAVAHGIGEGTRVNAGGSVSF